jgi:hypothetical protein
MSERRWKADDEGWSTQTTSYLLYEGDRALVCIDPEGEGQWSIGLFDYRHHAADIEFTGTLDQAQDFACHVLAWYEQHGEDL